MAALSTAPRLVAHGKGRAATKKGDENEKISLAEDLMREHGVLKRVLLIYRAIMNRIDSKRDFPPDVIISSARLIRAFVEDYHEKLEEDYLSPGSARRTNWWIWSTFSTSNIRRAVY